METSPPPVTRLPRTAQPYGTAEDVCVVDAAHPRCHCVTVAALPGPGPERLVAAWYAGSAECRPDVAVFFASWTEEAGWSAPGLLVDTPGLPDGNPVLGVSPSGALHLVFATLAGGHWRTSFLRRMVSADGGRSWTRPEDLAGGRMGWMVRNKPIAAGGAWLLPAYDEIAWESFVLRSDDDGHSWEPGGRIVAERGCIQATLLPGSGGSLNALLRCGKGGGPTWLAASPDGGRSWSAARATPVENPNSGCDAVSRPDGAWLLVCNDALKPVGRHVLALRVSHDGGASWPGRGVLVQGEGEYSYPAVIPAADGGLHVLYTHERTSIRHLRVRAHWPE